MIRSAVLAAILAGPATRAALSEAAALSAETITEDAAASGRQHRSTVPLQPRADLGLVCGIDLGATNCRFLVADLSGRPVTMSQELTPASIGAGALADWIADRVRALRAASPAPLRAVAVPCRHPLPGRLSSPRGATPPRGQRCATVPSGGSHCASDAHARRGQQKHGATAPSAPNPHIRFEDAKYFGRLRTVINVRLAEKVQFYD